KSGVSSALGAGAACCSLSISESVSNVRTFQYPHQLSSISTTPGFLVFPEALRQVARALCPNDQSKTCFLLRRRVARPALHFGWRSRSGMRTVGNGRSSRPGSGAGRRAGALVLRRPDELRVLNAVAEALNSSPDVRQALERTLTLVASLLGLRTGWVWLLDPETQQFYSAAVQNLPSYLHEPVRMTGHSCWCIEEFNAGELTPKNIDRKSVV